MTETDSVPDAEYISHRPHVSLHHLAVLFCSGTQLIVSHHSRFYEKTFVVIV